MFRFDLFLCVLRRLFNAGQCTPLRGAGRAGLAPSPAFTRTSWCLTRALRRVPPGPSLSLAAGPGAPSPADNGKEIPPPPAPAAARFLIGTGKCLFQQKAGWGPPAAPLSRGEGGGRCEAAGPHFLPPGREGPGKDQPGPGLWAGTGPSRARGSVGERVCWSKRLMVRAQVACFAYVVVGRENAPLRHC